MHNEWKTGVGCFLSWEDRIKERGSAGGGTCRCCQIAALHSPDTLSVDCFLFHPFSTASFSFKGKWQVEDITTQRIRKSTGVKGEGEINLRCVLDLFKFCCHLKLGQNEFSWCLTMSLSRDCTLCFMQSTPLWFKHVSAAPSLVVPRVLHVIQTHLSLPDVASL